MKTIPLGSHLVTPRTGYSHHGIYVGGDRVIHYSGLASGFSSGPVEETSLLDFAGERPVSVRKYKEPRHVGLAAVERAKSRIGESNYDVHGNNCEHFCHWVIMGSSRSEQVENVEDYLDLLVPSAVIVGIKLRKHRLQESEKKKIIKDVATSCVVPTGLTILATGPALPLVIGYKALKRILCRNFDK